MCDFYLRTIFGNKPKYVKPEVSDEIFLLERASFQMSLCGNHVSWRQELFGGLIHEPWHFLAFPRGTFYSLPVHMMAAKTQHCP